MTTAESRGRQKCASPKQPVDFVCAQARTYFSARSCLLSLSARDVVCLHVSLFNGLIHSTIASHLNNGCGYQSAIGLVFFLSSVAVDENQIRLLVCDCAFAQISAINELTCLVLPSRKICFRPQNDVESATIDVWKKMRTLPLCALLPRP